MIDNIEEMVKALVSQVSGIERARNTVLVRIENQMHRTIERIRKWESIELRKREKREEEACTEQ